MAKVEMDGYEYMELMDKCKELDTLKQSMIDSLKVEIGEDYDRPTLTWRYILPEEVQQIILNKMAEALIKYPEYIEELRDNNTPCLVIDGGYFTRDWGNSKYPNTVDLRNNPEFKKIWDGLEAEEEE